jgi:hypothetical protein
VLSGSSAPNSRSLGTGRRCWWSAWWQGWL